MGIGEVEVGVGGSRLLMVLIAVATMTVNPYVGLIVVLVTLVAIAISQAIPQIPMPNIFEGFLESRVGKYLKSRYGHHYEGLAKAGRFGPVEAGTFIAWVVASLACFGLITLPDTTYQTLAITVVVLSGLIMLAQKAQLKFTALEMVCFVVSVMLPIMASGVIQGFTLPADWVANTWNKVGLWGVSAVSTVVMAYQD